ncbi:hypothetical protein [Neptuniibacter sp. QD37_11]|uniref:hypothetical protein n=1 Tax=Neptuniibacter sp. QD37_11 TaxID=3398209 RepID=UPI0039F501B6
MSQLHSNLKSKILKELGIDGVGIKKEADGYHWTGNHVVELMDDTRVGIRRLSDATPYSLFAIFLDKMTQVRMDYDPEALVVFNIPFDDSLKTIEHLQMAYGVSMDFMMVRGPKRLWRSSTNATINGRKRRIMGFGSTPSIAMFELISAITEQESQLTPLLCEFKEQMRLTAKDKAKLAQKKQLQFAC